VDKFNGGGDHYGNFLDAVRSRKVDDLHADILEGHLSAALAHTGTISYRLGEKMPVSAIQKRLSAVKCNDDTAETLERTVAHLKANGVDLDKTMMALGPMLEMDGRKEVFLSSDEANAMLTRRYRAPFVVPPAGQV
jgi:hypothetical protein